MIPIEDSGAGARPVTVVGAYEPPRVERVLSASELELEILYAGAEPSPPPF
jgi:hypothetical protein